MKTIFLIATMTLGALDSMSANIREATGYGAGDTLQEAVSAAKRDALVNAAGMKVAVETETGHDELLSDKAWFRSCGTLLEYSVIEKGESFEGVYARVKAKIRPEVLTRPLKEAATLGFSLNDSMREEIISDAIAFFDRKEMRVVSTGIGKDRGEAISHACRVAVERGIGRFYDVSAKVEKDTISREQTIEVSNGYVKNYTVVKESSMDDGLISVEVNALIGVGAATSGAVDGEAEIQLKNAYEAFKIELDNMKSVVPFLYEVETGLMDGLSNGQLRVHYRIGINSNMFNNVFLPRLIQILSRVCVRKPILLSDFGVYNKAKNSVRVPRPEVKSGVDEFGITIVDKAGDGRFDRAINFTIPPDLRKMYKSWRRQMFDQGEIKVLVVSEKDGRRIFASDPVTIKARLLHTTSVPYFARGWGFWYHNLWLPVLSDDNVYIEGTIAVPKAAREGNGNISVVFADDRPKINMDEIEAARLGNEGPTPKELAISILVRLLLGVVLFFDFWLIKKAFQKKAFLGLIALVMGATAGLGILSLIIL